MRFLKVGLAVSGLAVASFLLAGCKPSTPAPSTSGTSDISGSANTGYQQTNTTAPSPLVKAQTTDQAVVSEGTQINTLNQNSTSVDQSLNDQQINVD